MKVIILCGGRGVRAFPFTEYLPKPMLPIGGSPILNHVIRYYLSHGFNEFILAAGYRKNVIEDYFHAKDFGAKITVLDTGDNADTGERIKACEEYVDDEFLVTYGDGLSDVPIKEVIKQHRQSKALATLTSVPLRSQYGVIKANEEGIVTSMVEKPTMKGQWINAGFFVCSKEIFNHWEGTNFEQHLLPKLVEKEKLGTYCHDGFFKSMDSYKDQQEFEEVWDSGNCPWKIW